MMLVGYGLRGASCQSRKMSPHSSSQGRWRQGAVFHVEATLKDEIPNLEGRKLIYECYITTPDGSQTCIRSVWLEAIDRSHMRLVTAYPFQ